MMSQRRSPEPGAAAQSVPFTSGSREGFEKFMSAILTYLGFNVTKL
jgi:hypothetical protein